MCVPRTQPAARTFLSPSKPLHPHIEILCKQRILSDESSQESELRKVILDRGFSLRGRCRVLRRALQ